MATIYRRIKHLRVTATQQIKMQIGTEVCKLYFSQQRTAKIFKIKSIEPEGEFQALSYPKGFHPEIDKIILKHCQPSNHPTVQAPRPKRTRINHVGSSDVKFKGKK